MILTDFRILLGVLSIVLAGCGCVQHGGDTGEGGPNSTEETSGDKFTLNLTVIKSIPYCGGMAPTEEMLASLTGPYSGAVFYLYKDALPATKDGYTKVIADGNGVISLELEAGNYFLTVEDKLLSLEEFIALKKIDGIHYKNGPDTCYERWKDTPNFTFELTKDTVQTMTMSERCFTGDNPCLQYTGPYPP